MNRRKYLLSTIALGAGLGIASQYNNTQPVIASNIDLEDSIEIPSEVEESTEFTLQLTLTDFEITPRRIGKEVDLHGVEVRGKTNSTSFRESESIPIENDILLSNNQTVNDVLNDEQAVIPLTVEFNESSFRVVIEFTIKTDNGDYNIREKIRISSDDNWSEPNEYPGNLTPSEDLDGSGTEENPYIITNDQELQSINKELDAHYELGQNIDTSLTNQWNEEAGAFKGFEPIGEFDRDFTGSLNGRGYEIKGLYIDRKDENDIGLIGSAEDDAEIKNVGLLNIDLTGEFRVGGLIGRNQSIEMISNSYATGNVNGYSFVGGLIGSNVGGGFNLHSFVNVQGNDEYIGGLIGEHAGSNNVENSYAAGNVTGVDRVGGLVGENSSIIKNSYATGDVTGYGFDVSGFVGFNRGGLIRDSYSLSEVNGKGDERNFGGFVGSNSNSGDIENSYSVGKLNTQDPDDNIGGFIGRQSTLGTDSGDVLNTYWDIDSSGLTDSDGGTGLSISKMQGNTPLPEEDDTMSGFDFDEVWETFEDDYPVLQALDTQLQLDNR